MTSDDHFGSVNVRGLDVLVFNVTKNHVKTTGRKCGRNVVKVLQGEVNHNPNSIVFHLEQLIKSVRKSGFDSLLICRQLPIYSLSLIHQAAVNQGCVLGLGVSDDLEVRGFVVTSIAKTNTVIELASANPSYPHHVFLTYNALCPRRGLQSTPLTSKEIFRVLHNCRLQELRQSILPVDVPEIILSYISPNENSKFNDKLTEWLYLECVLVLPNLPNLQSEIQRAASEYGDLVKNNSFRWPFFFGLEKDRQMSWGNSKTFRTILYTPQIKSLYDALCDTIPTLACQTPDCLPTWYKTGKTRLNYHQDKFGEKIFGRRELVILLFAGASRNLSIKRSHFTRTVRCTPLETIILTPCANLLFFHAKLPSKSRQPSLTFAFRRGVPPRNAHSA